MAGKLEKAVTAKVEELAEQFDGELEAAADDIVLVLAKKNQTDEQLKQIHSDLIDQIAEKLHEMLDAEDDEEEGDEEEENDDEEDEDDDDEK